MKAMSLFSGCLGFDLGFEKAGIDVVGFCDKSTECRETILANKPKAVVFDDVFDPKIVAYAKRNKVDVVFGGSPCQSFSTIGNMKFLDDPRGTALLGLVKVVEQVHPKLFVLENVKGILCKKNESFVQGLIDKFSTIGYKTSLSVLNAADFGSPQSRNRVFIIGCLDHSAKPVFRQSRIRRKLRDVVDGSDRNPKDCLGFTTKIATFMDMVPAGGNWKSLPPNLIPEAMGNANLKSGGLTAYYRRLSYDKPSPTLVTSPSHKGTTLCHPDFTRPLSLEEYRRIQGFPEKWKLVGSLRHKYEQLGNAVPLPLAKAVGDAVVRMLQ